jgi:hypothetical protein
MVVSGRSQVYILASTIVVDYSAIFGGPTVITYNITVKRHHRSH